MMGAKYMSLFALLGLTLAPAMDADAKRAKAKAEEAPTEEVLPKANPLEGIYDNIDIYIAKAEGEVRKAEECGSNKDQIDAKAELTVYKVLQMDVQRKAPLEVTTASYDIFDELGDYTSDRDGSREVMYDAFDALMEPIGTLEESIDNTIGAVRGAQSLQSPGCLGYQTFLDAVERVTGIGVNEVRSYSDAIRVILNDDVNTSCDVMADLFDAPDSGPVE